MLLLKNARFVSELTENKMSSGDVLIDGEKIVEISNCIAESASYEIVDLEGKYLLPGFIDIHVHLNLSGGDTLYDNFKDPYFMTLESYKFSLDSLKAGFTTIRDVGSNNACVNGIRDVINKGLLIGPRIISSGKIVTPSENGNQYFEDMYAEADGVEEIHRQVRKELKNGADFIKIMASGAIMNPGGEPGCPIYTDKEIEEIVKLAKLKNTYVAAHAHSDQAIRQCIKAGVKTIEHSSLVSQESIDMVKGRDDVYLIPTVTAFAALSSANSESSFIDDKLKRYASEFTKCIKNAYQNGLELGFATDQGVEGTFHGENADEFIFRSELIGMKNLDILKQATAINAKILGLENEIGFVKSGLIADLVILNENPLENIKVCRNGVHLIVKSGKIVN